MNNPGQHIVSRFRWNTSFDVREQVNDLQSRLSAWSRLDMQREVNAIFDRFCPPDQVWSIPSLELDLGEIDFDYLEPELNEKIKQRLPAKLQELLTNYQLQNGPQQINITSVQDTGVRFLRHFFLHGVRPWTQDASRQDVNDVLEEEWAGNSDAIMDMLHDIAVSSKTVRRRMAWQVSEPNITAIIRKMEPANCDVIIEFRNSMVAVQQKETIVQSPMGDFKKNLWYWILNYLFTKHGSLFNKKEFLKSSLRQMAGHYNVQFEELLGIVMQLATKMDDVYGRYTEFVTLLKSISEVAPPGLPEDGQLPVHKDARAATGETLQDQEELSAKLLSSSTEGRRRLLNQYFLHHTYKKSPTGKKEFNELVVMVAQRDAQWFRSLLVSLKHEHRIWVTVVNDLDDAALETIFMVWNAGAIVLVKSIQFLSALCKRNGIPAPRNLFWETGIAFLGMNGNNQPAPRQVLTCLITRLEQHTNMPGAVLLEQLTLNTTANTLSNVSEIGLFRQLQREYASKILSAPAEQEQVRLTELLKQLSRKDMDAASYNQLEATLAACFKAHPALAVKVLAAYPDKTVTRKITARILTGRMARIFLPHLPKEKAALLWQMHDLLVLVRQHNITTQDSAATYSTSLPASYASIIFITGVREMLLKPADTLAAFAELLIEELYKKLPASAAPQFFSMISRLLNSSTAAMQAIPATVKEKLFSQYAFVPAEAVAERIIYIINKTPYRQEEISKLLVQHYRHHSITALRNTKNNTAAAIISYLLPGGTALKQKLATAYAEHLYLLYAAQAKAAIVRRLDELFWKTIVQHKQYKGNPAKFCELFFNAVIFSYPLLYKKTGTANANKFFLLSGNDINIPGHLQTGNNNIEENNSSHTRNSLNDTHALLQADNDITGNDGQTQASDSDNAHNTTPNNNDIADQAQTGNRVGGRHSIAGSNGDVNNNASSKATHSPNPAAIPTNKLIDLLEECFSTEKQEVTLNNTKYAFRTIWNAVLRQSPGSLLVLIKQYPLTSARLNMISAASNFTSAVSWLAAEMEGRTAMQASALQNLYTYAEALLPEAQKQQIQQEYWHAIWLLIRQNGFPVKTFDRLIDEVIHAVIIAKLKDPLTIWGEWDKKQPWFLPGIKRSLMRTGNIQPGFTFPPIKSRPGIQLFRSGQTAWLYTLLRTVIKTKQIPLWFPHHAAGYNEADLLNDVLQHFPVAFLNFFQSENLTAVQWEWIHDSIDAALLIKAVAQTEPERRQQLEMVQQCIAAIAAKGNKTWAGVTAMQVQSILAVKIFTAWRTGNWRMLSPASFWQELCWSLQMRHNVSLKRLLPDIEKTKTSLPAPLQQSFNRFMQQYRKGAIKPALPVPNLKNIPTPMKKQEEPSPAREGIMVYNAGLVLINSYILLLFDRLGITSGNKFVNKEIQLQAVHYLQYVVTGHSTTEESYLPLNKLLCGLGTSQPVPDSIEITGSIQTMIEGLLKAVIGYWPAIGDTSVDGFRGNWLVRKGMLTELDDNWDLSIEKKPYDVLLGRSPFSFSVVKLPWMQKPLHVTWPY